MISEMIEIMMPCLRVALDDWQGLSMYIVFFESHDT